MSDRSYPRDPIVCVGAVIWKEDKCLLIQRGKEPMKGGWSIPGGKLELGESLHEGIKREIMEESGLTVRIAPLIDVVDYIEKDDDGRVKTHYCLVDYMAFWEKGDPVAASDAVDARWVSLEGLESYALWDKTRSLIEKSAKMIANRVR